MSFLSLPLPLLFLPFLPLGFAASDNKSEWAQAGITIPTSTVISIGLGFLAFSAFILLFLLSFRLNRIRKLAKRNGVPFKTQWRNEGGTWGWLTSFGDSDVNHTSLIGATGRTLDYNRYLYRLYMGLEGDGAEEKDKEKVIPRMWDCDWFSGVGGNEQNEVLDQPLSVTPSPLIINPSKSETPPPPALDICVLIALPSSRTIVPDQIEDLPELIIGSTTLLPTILTTPLNRVTSNTSVDQDKDKKLEIQQIEYSQSQDRKRAEWKLDESKGKGFWYIDGLGD
ncbi:hypothetical protein I302_105672 [Kwoniella bestiolae CBS 10118]|uniref:Uncharacterized protein n=1 Tax=Kwoniella bestiolae CBS 10118 TaxID=1296100 RepID=A0A1B9G1T1_9TREE|nr:hypothetical protein I302_04790 [Kwoniella bestiolae CBS 10118]OCF24980.1 hypothetical protein I302_04790 [Kwoniella bestiolae CBS 10118]